LERLELKDLMYHEADGMKIGERNLKENKDAKEVDGEDEKRNQPKAKNKKDLFKLFCALKSQKVF